MTKTDENSAVSAILMDPDQTIPFDCGIIISTPRLVNGMTMDQHELERHPGFRHDIPYIMTCACAHYCFAHAGVSTPNDVKLRHEISVNPERINRTDRGP